MAYIIMKLINSVNQALIFCLKREEKPELKSFSSKKEKKVEKKKKKRKRKRKRKYYMRNKWALVACSSCIQKE